MTSRHWSDGLAAVILLPSGTAGADLISLVSNWTKCWMLKPAFWICDGDIIDSTEGPPRVLATVIGRNGSEKIDLFSQLSRLKIQSLKVVAARVVGSDEKTDLAQDKSVALIEKYIEQSRPIRTRIDGQDTGPKILKINLIFAPTDQKGASFLELLESHWDFNIVVAPEDRTTPNSFDGFTRYADGEKLNGFILSNIASTAGIWSGQQKSVFELFSEFSDSSPIHNQVKVMRTFVRGILSEGLSVRVAVEALKLVGNSETSKLSGRAIPNGYLAAYEAERAKEVIGEMLTDTLNFQNGALKYRRIPPEFEVSQDGLGVFGSFRFFFESSWSLIKVLPLWFFAAFWNFLARLITAKLFGAKGKEVVKGAIDFPKTDLDKDAVRHLYEIKDRRNKIKHVLDQWPKNTLRKSEPGLWSDLRKLILGRLDGSTLPTGLVHEKDEVGIRVLGDLNEVLPSLHAHWSLPNNISRNLDSEPRSATWKEMDVLESIEEFLITKVSIADKDLDEINVKLNELEEQLTTLDNSLKVDVEKLNSIQRNLTLKDVGAQSHV